MMVNFWTDRQIFWESKMRFPPAGRRLPRIESWIGRMLRSEPDRQPGGRAGHAQVDRLVAVVEVPAEEAVAQVE